MPMRHTLLIAVFVLTPLAAGAQSIGSEQNRRDAFAQYRSGRELLQREQWEKAVAAFDRAIRLVPLFTDAHYARGEAFMGWRRYANAVHAFERTIEAARELHAIADSDRVQVDHQIDEEIR